MHFLNRAMAATVVGALLMVMFCSPAAASEVDSWGGQVFLRHHTDVFAWPHRALEFSNTASLVYVPPTTSESDFRAVSSSDWQDVGGVLTIGKAEWQGILGANAPHAFNPVAYHGMGSWRGWGRGLKGGGLSSDLLTFGMSSYLDADPTPKMQIGGAYQVNADVRMGVVFQQFSHIWTDAVTDHPDPGEAAVTETMGYEITGTQFGVSGSANDVGPLSMLEGTFSYGKSERDEFQGVPADADSMWDVPWIDTENYDGNGEASTMSFAAVGTIQEPDWVETRIPLDFVVYGRWDKFNTDFADGKDVDDPSGDPMTELDGSGFDFRLGFTHQDRNDFAVALGFQKYTTEWTYNYVAEVYDVFGDPGSAQVRAAAFDDKDEEDYTIFPYCDCAGTVEIGKGFAVQWGLAAGWEKYESTYTEKIAFEPDFVPTGEDAVQTDKYVVKDESLMVAYSVGGRYSVNDHFNIAVTFNTDHLGNPGAIVFGDSGTTVNTFSGSSSQRDTPLTVLSAQLKF